MSASSDLHRQLYINLDRTTRSIRITREELDSKIKSTLRIRSTLSNVRTKRIKLGRPLLRQFSPPQQLQEEETKDPGKRG